VVFLDDHNSCRGQMAEAIGQSLDQPKFVFTSAALDPRPIDQGAVAFLQSKGIDHSRALPRSLEGVPNLEFVQIIVALSPEAKKAFPKGTKAVCLEWNLEDPSQVGGTPEQKQAAYEAAYNFLKAQINDVVEAVLGDDSK
jgi:protein-tyrosine-phosphatase